MFANIYVVANVSARLGPILDAQGRPRGGSNDSKEHRSGCIEICLSGAMFSPVMGHSLSPLGSCTKVEIGRWVLRLRYLSLCPEGERVVNSKNPSLP